MDIGGSLAVVYLFIVSQSLTKLFSSFYINIWIHIWNLILNRSCLEENLKKP